MNTSSTHTIFSVRYCILGRLHSTHNTSGYPLFFIVQTQHTTTTSPHKPFHGPARGVSHKTLHSWRRWRFTSSPLPWGQLNFCNYEDHFLLLLFFFCIAWSAVDRAVSRSS